MFGASFQPAASGLSSATYGPGFSPDVMESPSASRRSERLERLIENEIVPRLMTSHRVGPVSPALARAVAREFTDADVTAFVRAVRGQDDTRAAAFVRELLDEGVSVEAVYLDLLAPTARRFGTMFDDDECDFVEVTVALGRMQRLLRDLSQIFLANTGAASPVGSVLLTCIPGEQHTLGIIMVGEFLLRDGWRVLVGAPWSESDLLTTVATEWFDVVGFSVGSEHRLPALKRDIRRLKQMSRNPQLQIMVGGQVFRDQPELAAEIGATAIASDAGQAPAVARTLLAASRAHALDAVPREAHGTHGQLSEALRRE